MYFSSLVKQELTRMQLQDLREQKGELLALILLRGEFDPEEKKISVKNENPGINRVVYSLFKKIFGYELKLSRIKKGQKKSFYLVTVDDTEKSMSVLNFFQLRVGSDGRIVKKLTKRQRDIELFSAQFLPRAFLRGAFLASGFMNDPERMYHLEISCNDKDEALMVQEIFHYTGFITRISYWQKKWTVYMKKSEDIFEFLRFIGIQRALLNFQDVIARKELLNTVNRLVNCETANLDKTILSASRQLFYIEVVKKNIGMENLPPGLKEVIQVRENHPYATIKELTGSMEREISKSGLFHRLKKIEKLASSYLTEDIDRRKKTI